MTCSSCKTVYEYKIFMRSIRKNILFISSELLSLTPIKKVTSILLILLLGFNSFGLFFFYWGKIQLCKIKAEDFADTYYRLPEKSLTIFSSGNKNFQFNNDDEILADGKLYDIVKTEIINGATYYFTLSDEEEDNYVQQLGEWSKSNTEEKSLPSKTISLHIGKYFTIKKECETNLHLYFRVTDDVSYKNDLFIYISPFINIFSPPPDNLLS